MHCGSEGSYLNCIFNSLTCFCADINECGEAGMHRCDPNATCVNNIGSYDCMCDPGYTGDGFNCTSRILIIVCISA